MDVGLTGLDSARPRTTTPNDASQHGPNSTTTTTHPPTPTTLTADPTIYYCDPHLVNSSAPNQPVVSRYLDDSSLLPLSSAFLPSPSYPTILLPLLLRRKHPPPEPANEKHQNTRTTPSYRPDTLIALQLSDRPGPPPPPRKRLSPATSQPPSTTSRYHYYFPYCCYSTTPLHILSPSTSPTSPPPSSTYLPLSDGRKTIHRWATAGRRVRHAAKVNMSHLPPLHPTTASGRGR